MELKDFIKNAIIAITDGMLEAQDELKDKDVIINPEKLDVGNYGEKILRTDGSRFVQELDFEINVDFEEKAANEGGGKLTVFNIASIGLEGKKEINLFNSNKLKFKIPIAFPTSKTPDIYNKKRFTGAV